MIKLAEILDEYKVNQPIKSWKLNSDDYKSFYQLVTLCDRWGVDYGEEDPNWDFSNDYYFFLRVFLTVDKKNIKPDYCIFTEDNLDEIADDFNLVTDDPSDPDLVITDYNDPTIKALVTQLNKHSGRK
jgi:hypothetical protein